ncbi:MAG: hypothetical protein HY077_18210 [Elusimicrobia bacterium]|nr:hypothetical protein [Elusimicrobiota bacterium]
MRTIRRTLAAALALCLVGLSPGAPCYQALALDVKLSAVETPSAAGPAARLATIPALTVGVDPVNLKTDIGSVAAAPAVVPETSLPNLTARRPTAPWTQRLAQLGERFTEIIGLKAAGDQLSGFGGFFDFGLQPAMAMAGAAEFKDSEPVRPQVLMMSAAREERSGSSRGAPPAPKSPETAQERLASRSGASGAKLMTYSIINTGLSLIAAVAAAGAGVKLSSALILALVPLATTLVSAAMRRAASAKLETAGAEKNFAALFAAEKQAGRSVWVSRLGALAPMDLGGMLALRLMHAAPLAAAVLGAAVFGGWAVWRGAKKFGQSVGLQRAQLYGVLKEGEPQIPIEDLPGQSALEKHGRYFSGGEAVAKFRRTYHYIRMQGLSPFGSFTTAVSWHLFFSGKTQKNMTPEERDRFKPGRFDNYIPNFPDAQGPTNTRIYAMRDIPGIAKRGDVDMREFERIFRDFAPGGDYVTMKDLRRLWAANAERDADRTNWLTRRIGKTAFNKRFKQLLIILADRVVEEDGKLVPAISRAGLLRYYEGGAAYDLLRERGGN